MIPWVFFETPKYDVSVDEPIANSSKFGLPMMTAFWSFSFETTVASYTDTKFSSIRLAAVVFISVVTILSLTAIGIPAKGVSNSVIASASLGAFSFSEIKELNLSSVF